jgi:hypothetical protein
MLKLPKVHRDGTRFGVRSERTASVGTTAVFTLATHSSAVPSGTQQSLKRAIASTADLSSGAHCAFSGFNFINMTCFTDMIIAL